MKNITHPDNFKKFEIILNKILTQQDNFKNFQIRLVKWYFSARQFEKF